MHKALILDKRAGTLALQICRALARRDYEVDILGTPASIAFRSRYCARALKLQSWNPEQIGRYLRQVFAADSYDAIYLCSEEVLAIIPSLVEYTSFRALPMPEMPILKTLLSKHETLARVAQERIPTPLTVVPEDENDAEQLSREIKLPFLIKGERGDNCRNLRVVTNRQSLLPLYREIVRSEVSYGGRPALQEIIRGPAYSVGGLFHEGRALRLCAHRKLLTYPPAGGVTVRGITERPEDLLAEALKAFAVFRYTGLGHAEFIRDERDGKFKFIEINPRVWGSIGIAEHAGVDLYRPYQALARGVVVPPDLHYEEGIIYHRFSAEMHLIRKSPLRLAGFLKDAMDPRVASDFTWSDPGPYLAAVPLIRSNREIGPYGGIF